MTDKFYANTVIIHTRLFVIKLINLLYLQTLSNLKLINKYVFGLQKCL